MLIINDEAIEKPSGKTAGFCIETRKKIEKIGQRSRSKGLPSGPLLLRKRAIFY
jgi:hypothetical protein